MVRGSLSIKDRIRDGIFCYFGAQFIKYNLLGMIGFLLNLGATFALAEFFLGRESYLVAFLIGNIINTFYNYLVYVRHVFPVKGLSDVKKAFFFVYSGGVILLQMFFADRIVLFVGLDWYLPVLALVIGAIGTFSYFVFKSHLFTS